MLTEVAVLTARVMPLLSLGTGRTSHITVVGDVVVHAEAIKGRAGYRTGLTLGAVPRRHRSRSGPTAPTTPSAAVPGWAREETAADGTWSVRNVPGAAALKTYRCPGCDQEVGTGVGHVVAWPADEHLGGTGTAYRRHWHSPCWAARHRRRPTSRYG